MHSLKANCSSQFQSRGTHAESPGRQEGPLKRNRTRWHRSRLDSSARDVQNSDQPLVKDMGPIERMDVKPQTSFDAPSIRANSMIELRSKLTPEYSEAAAKLLATNGSDLEAALPFLLELLETDNERVKLLAVQAVRDIACTPSLQLRLAAAGGAEAIAGLLTPPKYDVFWLQTISKAAAEALSAMCYGQPSVKAAVADSGAIPQLVELASIYQTFPKNNNSFDKVHKLEAAGLAAARVLCSLADVESVKSRLGQGGAISVLTRMLDEDDNPAEAHKYAAATLAKISVGC